MPSVVYQKDKRSGITYAYESISYWDKNKQQSRAKRTLIGRLDPQTGEIVPTDGRYKKKREAFAAAIRGPQAAEQTARCFYGATYLLDQIGAKIGITEDLKRCFPDTYRQILSIAYYLILEDKSPQYRLAKWSDLHKHPYGKEITSQRSSVLFASIREEKKSKFFHLQGKRRTEKEFWAYDITTIFNYSKLLKQVQYGKNKEHDHLPQLNLAMVFGEKTNLPFHYRKLAGNIPDAKTAKNLLAELDILGFSKVKLIMDRDFYSEDNINALFKEHLKFIIAVKMSFVLIRKELDPTYDHFRSFENYSEKYELYYHTVQAQRPYSHISAL